MSMFYFRCGKYKCGPYMSLPRARMYASRLIFTEPIALDEGISFYEIVDDHEVFVGRMKAESPSPIYIDDDDTRYFVMHDGTLSY